MTDREAETLLEIVRVGLLNIRNFAFAGRVHEAAVEADHLHNIPEILVSRSDVLLQYYLRVSRAAFKSECTWTYAQFEPLWSQLDCSADMRERSMSGGVP